jgi:hypothetical protein
VENLTFLLFDGEASVLKLSDTVRALGLCAPWTEKAGLLVPFTEE